MPAKVNVFAAMLMRKRREYEKAQAEMSETDCLKQRIRQLESNRGLEITWLKRDVQELKRQLLISQGENAFAVAQLPRSLEEIESLKKEMNELKDELQDLQAAIERSGFEVIPETFVRHNGKCFCVPTRLELRKK